MSGMLNSIYSNITFALQLHSKALYSLQEQAATGSRINRPSDDPSAAYRVLGLDSQQRYLANFMDNIDNAINTQDTASSVLQNMSTSLTDTMTHLTQIISGTYGQGQGGQDTRKRVAQEIDDVLEQMVSSANTKYVDQYIFGGDNTSSAPYVVQRDNGKIVGVTYQGSIEGRNIEIAPGVQSNATYAGDDIFGLNNRGTPTFSGTTGAKAGTGTSSVKGDLQLTVTNDGSNYKLSIDNGSTETTIPSSGDISNIAVTNSDGKILYVDATNITTTGTARVNVPGTTDLFNVLINARDLLRNTNGLSDAAIADSIDKAAESLGEIKNVLVGKEASIGTRINFLNSLKNSLENIKTNGENEATTLQEADIAQVSIDISRRQTLYQMSLSVAGKIMSMSLLDFIQ
jgi:flagellar hook-associated protein 3 FlgL